MIHITGLVREHKDTKMFTHYTSQGRR